MYYVVQFNTGKVLFMHQLRTEVVAFCQSYCPDMRYVDIVKSVFKK